MKFTNEKFHNKYALKLDLSRVSGYNLYMEATDIIAEKDQIIQTLEAKVKEQDLMIGVMQTALVEYRARLLLSKRRQFGSTSEQIPNQLSIEGLAETIFNEAEDQAEVSLPEPTYEEVTIKRKKRVGKRKDDLSSLPVKRIEHELPESERVCPECGEPIYDIGVTVRDEIETIPARHIHIEHAIHAYACKNCEKTKNSATVIRADAPSALIAGSLATPSAVANIAVQKYANGMPLYRQERSLAYDNVSLSRQTMANWLIYCGQNYLSAIYERMITVMKNETVLHADETSVQVLSEPGRDAKTKSFEWLYRTSGHTEKHVVIYEYKETRKQEHPKEFLKGFSGYLHCDGYQVYHNLPPGIIIVGCWAHARRYWEKIYVSLPEDKRDGSIAETGLAYISLLFLLEDEYSSLSPNARYEIRMKYSKLVTDAYFAWVNGLNALPKSLLGEAVHYSLSQRQYLENVFLDGRLELSNNRAERSIKPFVQGRKQWLFSATPNGAVSSSIIYSIIETAKENNLHPYHYIKYLLENLPKAKISELDSFMPWAPELPDYCHIPNSAKLPKREKKWKTSGHLHSVILSLRTKFGCQRPSK